MRSDIYGSLKNAVDRGTPLEKAVKSMIGSGYKESEVMEAAKAVESGMIPSFGEPEPEEKRLSKKEMKKIKREEAQKKVSQPQTASRAPQEQPTPPPKEQPTPPPKEQPTPQSPQKPPAQKLPTSEPSQHPQKTGQKPKYIGPGKRNSTIKIIVLSIVLVILLALLGTSILFKDQIIDFLNTLLG